MRSGTLSLLDLAKAAELDEQSHTAVVDRPRWWSDVLSLLPRTRSGGTPSECFRQRAHTAVGIDLYEDSRELAREGDIILAQPSLSGISELTPLDEAVCLSQDTAEGPSGGCDGTSNSPAGKGMVCNSNMPCVDEDALLIVPSARAKRKKRLWMRNRKQRTAS